MAKKQNKNEQQPEAGEQTGLGSFPADTSDTPEVMAESEDKAKTDEQAPQLPTPPADPPVKAGQPQPPKPAGKFKQLIWWCKTHKRIAIPAFIVLILAVLAAIPFSRYGIAGLFLKRDFKVMVVDQQTGKPVSSAQLTVDGRKQITDATGKASIRLSVGPTKLTVDKKYYKSAAKSVVVPILKQKDVPTIRLNATGRQVPVTVLNKISDKPLEGATIEADGAQAKTDKKGQAVLVVPAGKATAAVSIQANGFGTKSATLQVTTTQVEANIFTLTPSGKLYFLSNKSGKIDVVKSSLDGGERQLVLGGTGKEDKRNTILLASRDWKYLALLSKRDGGEHAKLFLIDTGTDQVTTMDEGNADFDLVGWSDDRFIYRVLRGAHKSWQPGATALKSYSAPNKKITLLDQSSASGTNDSDYINENFGSIFGLPNNEIVYTKTFSRGYYATTNGRQNTLNGIKADGSAKRIIKGFSITPQDNAFLELRPYGAGGVYLAAQLAGTNQYFEYENGQFKATNEVNDGNFYDPYPTYLQSPSGKQTFWGESRDGKNALFVGNEAGKDGKQIAVLSEFQTYGWFSDDYLLVSKSASELYIMPAGGSNKPLKLTDYYRPDFSFRGYGGGYGGL